MRLTKEMERLAFVISILLLVFLAVAGCSARKSSLLLGRFARGTLDDAQSVALPNTWELSPSTQTDSQNGGVEITVSYASISYQEKIFYNKDLFGEYAGRNPYYDQQLVFYVRVSNQSGDAVLLSPDQFVLIDDRGNQLATVGHDHIDALTKAKSPVSTTTRGIVEGASPGYFGLSFPVGKLVRASQWRYALLTQSALQRGFLYPAVVHDGLIAFWTPSSFTKKLTLRLPNIKTDFSSYDRPATSLEFIFEFEATHE